MFGVVGLRSMFEMNTDVLKKVKTFCCEVNKYMSTNRLCVHIVMNGKKIDEADEVNK